VPHRTLTIAGVALFVAIAVVAAAYALGYPVIDFNKAPKGPRTVVDDFGSLQVGAPAGMAPGVLPNQARRITSVEIDGKEHVLWVAPTTQGGFCEEWTKFSGGCRASRTGKAASRIGGGGLAGPNGFTVLQGSFFQSTGARIELRYADGQTDQIPFVWVTAPIDAGFYLYRVPDAHRRAGHQPTSITLYDSSGHVLSSNPLPAVELPDDVSHRVAGYPPLSVPAKAEYAERQQLFAWHADDGARIGLWIAPERGGGTCFWTNQGSGCSNVGHPVHGTYPPLGIGFQGGGKHVNLCCQVGKNVTRIEAVFADGDRIELNPKDGYLVWPIPARHYAIGHRLDELIAYNTAGRQIATKRISTNERALYPCTKPKNYGYGVTMCP
jgi:hypothetical protein